MRGPRPRPGTARAVPPAALLRLDLPCEALGFDPPPVPIQLRFLRQGLGWTMLMLVPAGGAGPAADWVRRHAEAKVVAAPGLAPRTLRCELATVPARWLGWLSTVRIVQVDLARTGLATLFVHGTGAQVTALAGRLGAGAPAIQRKPWGRPLADEPRLTPRQLDVLCHAVALGYFDVPHRVGLRGLGKVMDLSASAVSLLLRRAQGKVVQAYVDSVALAQGERMEPPGAPPKASPPKGA
jgi:hypothetical protein